MASAFSTSSSTLEELLSGQRAYRIPDYQRSYAWTIKEAGQLLDDVLIACSEAASTGTAEDGYFFGAVLLMRAPPDAAGGKELSLFDVVDGQQRLVTLTILLCVLRDLADDRSLPCATLLSQVIETPTIDDFEHGYRLRLRGEDGEFLHRYVQMPGAVLDMPHEDPVAASQSRILDVREHYAESLHDIEDAELEQLARFLLASCHFAVVITHSIDRAHRIFSVLNERGRPLARNDILKAQILGALDPAIRSEATSRWDELEKLLDGAFEELFSHVRILEGPTRGTIIAGISSAITNAGGPQRFFDEVLEPYARIFAAIRKPGRDDGLSPIINRHLSYLSWLGSSEWIAPVMLFWKQCAGDQQRLEEFLARFDRFSFGLRLLGIGADKRLARNTALVHWLSDGRSIDHPECPIEFSREETRNILYNLRSIHPRSQLTCKLLLLRLNDELAGSPQNLIPAKYTVEHILPQKPARNSQWRAWHPESEARAAATQSLGNLVLVTREQNDKARNLEFARKQAIYCVPSNETPWLTQEISGFTQWRAAEIHDREKRLLNAMSTLWKFEIANASVCDVGPSAARRAPRRRSAVRATA